MGLVGKYVPPEHLPAWYGKVCKKCGLSTCECLVTLQLKRTRKKWEALWD